MASAPGSRSARNVEKLKRKAKRKPEPKIATSSVGVTLGARQRSKKAANKRRGAAKAGAAA
ncbi:MAG: hypothetical protein R3D44_06555 [Hyphomicrobiaceae bacterium]